MATIYERANGITYAREFGSEPDTRVPVSYVPVDTFLGMPLPQVSELVSIAYAAESNSTLQAALERVKILYYLSKDTDGNSKT